MTATLIARLAEKDVLSFDTTLAGALPDLAGAMKTAYRAVTIEQLLNHTSGIPAEGPFGLSAALPRDEDEPGRAAPELRGRGADGSGAGRGGGRGIRVLKFQHDHRGRHRRTSDRKAWEQLMAEEVFAPLGIAQAGSAPGDRSSSSTSRAGISGKRRCRPGPMADNRRCWGPPEPSISGMRDWAKFALAHATMPEDFLSPESWARLHRPSSVEPMPRAGACSRQRARPGWSMMGRTRCGMRASS